MKSGWFSCLYRHFPRLILMILLVVPAISQAALVFSPCQIGAADSPQHMQAKCATLMVPENRANPERQKNRPARGHAEGARQQARAGCPVLHRRRPGPGRPPKPSWKRRRPSNACAASRDIVLVDQRGTGRSNRLDCPAAPERTPTVQRRGNRRADGCLSEAAAGRSALLHHQRGGAGPGCGARGPGLHRA